MGQGRAGQSPQMQLKAVSKRLVGDQGTQKLIDTRRGAIDWYHEKSPVGAGNNQFLTDYRDRHAGQTCAIIGNGPSLNHTDLSLLKDIPTFGLNRIYLMYDKLDFETTYHVVVNSFVVKQCESDFRSLHAPLFTTWKNRPTLRRRQHSTGYLSIRTGPFFGEDLVNGIWEGTTVTYVAMQIAFHMGFSKVILVGVDHRFKSEGPAHKLVTSAGADQNHFDPNYFGPGFKWQLPDLDTSEVAYRLADKTYRYHGRSIVDATVDGALTVFPKVSLLEAVR